VGLVYIGIKMGKHLLILENGKIIQQGNHTDLMGKQGYYKDLFEKQQTEKTI